jgi:galactose mutarotase-like enzyme
MLYTIQNEHMTVNVDDFGAELNSVMFGGIELLWQGDPEYWAGRAPILFPIIGKLKGGALLYGEKKYTKTKSSFLCVVTRIPKVCIRLNLSLL